MSEDRTVSEWNRRRGSCNTCGGIWEADTDHWSVQEGSCLFCGRWPDSGESKEEFMSRNFPVFIVKWPSRR